MVRYIHTNAAVTCSGGIGPVILNPTMAQRMLNASICAYNITPHGFSPDCEYWNLIKSTGDVSVITADPGHLNPAIDAGFVTTTTDGWVVLSLRGTLGSYNGFESFIAFLKDWWEDSESRLVPFFLGGIYMGQVHNGFYKAYLYMLSKVQTALDGVDWANVKGLQVTGHSKGAALTFLFAAWAKKKYMPSGLKTVEVNAFAAPLVGDHHFSVLYQALNIPTIRHQRAHDIVPFLPPYDSYDIFDHFHFYNSWTATALQVIGLDIHTGYHLTGDVIYYPGTIPGKVSPVAGSQAELESQQAIITAIKDNKSSEIEGAHSATLSYHPALFPT